MDCHRHIEIRWNMFIISQFVQFRFVEIDQCLFGWNETAVHLKLANFDSLRSTNAFQNVSGMVQSNSEVATDRCV